MLLSDNETQNVDMRLKCPFSMLVSGPSNCGKTSFVLELLKQRHKLYNKTVGKVFWFYKVFQNNFTEVDFIDQMENKMCTMEWLQDNQVPEYSTIVIDDMALEATDDTAKLFSVGSHHYKVNIIFICQNLFTQNKFFRDISLNSTYVVLFKNVRDKQQISNFAKQFAPGKNKSFLNIFTTATKEPHSYLLLDNHQQTNDNHRIISNYLLENGTPITIWLLPS